MSTAADLISGAAQELGITSAVESLAAADADLFLARLNQLVDQWNAVRPAVYASTFSTFTLPTLTNPVTIGPSGANWTVTKRPERIEAANLIVVSSPAASVVTNPIAIHNVRWWMDLTVPGVQTSYPTDLYYEPLYPNGNLWFWPVPTTAYQVTLQLPLVLGAFTLSTTFTMPPGYEAALLYTLAERCAAPMRVPLNPMTVQLAREARAVIFGNNTDTVNLVTQDAGMPSGAGLNRPTWNWMTGLDTGRSR